MPTIPHPADSPQTKTCTKCGETKPAAEYYVKDRRTGRLYAWCKACHSAHTCATLKRKYAEDPEPFKAAASAYTRSNKDRINAKRRLKRAENPQPFRARSKAWRDANHDRVSARKEAYKKRRPHVVIAARARYYESHREELLARHKAWREANPLRWADIARRTKHKRRAAIRGGGGTFTEAEWEAVKAAQGHRCLMCGMCEPLINLTVDHIVPISKGGTNTADNLQGLCKPCNSRKHAKVLDLRDRPKPKGIRPRTAV